MSRDVDERIVELQFDNSRFERKTRQTRNSLNALDEDLNRVGQSASAAGDELDAFYGSGSEQQANSMAAGLGLVGGKFNALRIIATTALMRITNAAITTGKQIVKSLSIDNISAGYAQYEQQLQSIRTLVNATGDSEDNIAAKVERLAWFSGETSYNYEAMLNTVSQLMASGVDNLDEAISMTTGLAAASAKAGASMDKIYSGLWAMQKAYSWGTVTAETYESLINTAGLSTAEFKEQLLEAGVAMGKLKKESDNLYKIVGKSKKIKGIEGLKESLSEGWLTKDVLGKVMENYSAFADELYTTIEYKGGEMMVEDANELMKTNINNLLNAYAKGLEGSFDMTTWEGLKEMDAINDKMKESILVSGAAIGTLTTTADGSIETFDGMALSAENFWEAVEKGYVTSDMLSLSLKDNLYYQEFFAEAERRAFQNGTELSAELKTVALDFQTMSEKAFFAGYEAKTFADAIGTVKKNVSKGWRDTFAQIFGGLTDSVKFFTSLSDALTAIFNKGAEERNKVLAQWVELGGRDDLFSLEEEHLGAIWNILKAIDQAITAIREAFSEVFGSITGAGLKGLTARFNEWTKRLIMSEETLAKFKNIFKGLAEGLKLIYKAVKAIWSIVAAPVLKDLYNVIVDVAGGLGYAAQVIGGSAEKFTVFEKILASAMKVLKSFMNLMHKAYVAITKKESLGEGIMWVADKIAGALDILAAILAGEPLAGIDTSGVGTVFGELIMSIIELGKTLGNLLLDLMPILKEIVQYVTALIKYVFTFFTGTIEEATAHPEDTLLYQILQSFVAIINAVMPILKWLLRGVNYLIEKLTDLVKDFSAQKLWDIIKEIFPILLMMQAIKWLYRTATLFKMVEWAVGAVSDAMEAVKFAAFAAILRQVAAIILSIGASIAMIAWGFKFFNDVDKDAMIRGTIAMGIFGAILITVTALLIPLSKRMEEFNRVVEKVGKNKRTTLNRKSTDTIAQMAGVFLALGAAMALFGLGMKWAGTIDTWWKWSFVLTAFGGFIATFIIVNKMIAKEKWNVNQMKRFGQAMALFGLAIMEVGLGMKIMGTLSWAGLAKGLLGLTTLIVGLIGIMAVARKVKNMNLLRLGQMFALFGVATIAASVSVVILGLMSWDMIKKGLAAMLGMVLAFAILSRTVKAVDDTGLKKLTKVFRKLALICGVMAGVMASMLYISWDAWAKAMAMFAIILGGVIAIGLLAKKMDLGSMGKITWLMLGLSVLLGTVAIIMRTTPDTKITEEMADRWAKILEFTVVMVLAAAILVAAAGKAKTSSFQIMALGTLLTSVAALMGAVALMVWLTGKIDSKTYNPEPMLLVLAGVGAILLALAIPILAMKDIKGTSMMAMAVIFIGLAGIMAILVGISTDGKQIDYGKFWTITGAMVVLIGAIAGALWLIKKVDTKSVFKMTIIIAAFAGAAVALAYVASIWPTNAWVLVGIGVVIASLGAGLLLAMEAVNKLNGTNWSSIGKFASIFAAVFGSLALVLLAAAVLAVAAKPDDLITVGILTALFVGIMFTMIGVYKLFRKVNNKAIKAMDNFVKFMASFTVAFVAFALCAALMTALDFSNGNFYTGWTLFIATVGLMLLAVRIIAKMEDARKSVDTFAILMASMVAGLVAFAICCLILQDINYSDAGKGILIFAAMIAVFMAMAAITGKFPIIGAGLQVVALGMLALGAAVLFFGGGLYLLAEGIRILTAIDPERLHALAESMDDIAKILSTVVRAAVEAAVSAILAGLTALLSAGLQFLNDIIDALLTFITDDLVIIIKALLKVIADIAQPLADTIGALILAVLRMLEAYIQPILDAVWGIVTKILDWLMDKLPVICDWLVKALSKLINLLISYLPKLEKDLGRLVGKILWELVKIAAKKVYYLGVGWLIDIIKGIFTGNWKLILKGFTVGFVDLTDEVESEMNQITEEITDGGAEAANAAANAGTNIMQSLKDSLSDGWNSTSKVFEEMFDDLKKIAHDNEVKIEAEKILADENSFKEYMKDQMAAGNLLDDRKLTSEDLKQRQREWAQAKAEEAVSASEFDQALQEWATKLGISLSDALLYVAKYTLGGQYALDANEIVDYDDLLRRAAEWNKLTSPQLNGSNGNAEIVKNTRTPGSEAGYYSSSDVTNVTINANGLNEKELAAEVGKVLAQQAERRNVARGAAIGAFGTGRFKY